MMTYLFLDLQISTISTFFHVTLYLRSRFMSHFRSQFFLLPNNFISISMTLKVIEGHKSSSNFSVNPTLSNTLINGSILIKIYINANIMNTQIFNLNKYQLKFHLQIVQISLSLSKSSSFITLNANLCTFSSLLFDIAWMFSG